MQGMISGTAFRRLLDKVQNLHDAEIRAYSLSNNHLRIEVVGLVRWEDEEDEFNPNEVLKLDVRVLSQVLDVGAEEGLLNTAIISFSIDNYTLEISSLQASRAFRFDAELSTFSLVNSAVPEGGAFAVPS